MLLVNNCIYTADKSLLYKKNNKYLNKFKGIRMIIKTADK